MQTIERRVCAFTFEKRDDGAPPRIIGHAAVFNRAADLGYFREQIAPGAFMDSIAADGDDIRALFNHDPNFVLGRNRAGTLSLAEDERGLAVDIQPPATQWANDLMVSMQRGDIDQMSFGFLAVEDSWDFSDKSMPVRTLLRAKLFDVSPVTYPAYDSTDCSVRSAEQIFRDLRREGGPIDPSLPARVQYVEFLRTL